MPVCRQVLVLWLCQHDVTCRHKSSGCSCGMPCILWTVPSRVNIGVVPSHTRRKIFEFRAARHQGGLALKYNWLSLTWAEFEDACDIATLILFASCLKQLSPLSACQDETLLAMTYALICLTDSSAFWTTRATPSSSLANSFCSWIPMAILPRISSFQWLLHL